MGQEIERKFLLVDESWRSAADQGLLVRQGYLSFDKECTVRVRLMGEAGFLTVKGQARDLVRPEFEYEIPVKDAEMMLSALCRGPLVEKRRYLLRYDGHVWEIDEFHGANAGLVVAEIELDDANESFARPPWLGTEVSSEARYLNASLARAPFSTW